jgi:L-asparagine transporter-like permease
LTTAPRQPKLELVKNLIIVVLVISTLVLGIILTLQVNQNQKLTIEIDSLSDQLGELESIAGLEKE